MCLFVSMSECLFASILWFCLCLFLCTLCRSPLPAHLCMCEKQWQSSCGATVVVFFWTTARSCQQHSSGSVSLLLSPSLLGCQIQGGPYHCTHPRLTALVVRGTMHIPYSFPCSPPLHPSVPPHFLSFPSLLVATQGSCGNVLFTDAWVSGSLLWDTDSSSLR